MQSGPKNHGERFSRILNQIEPLTAPQKVRQSKWIVDTPEFKKTISIFDEAVRNECRRNIHLYQNRDVKSVLQEWREWHFFHEDPDITLLYILLVDATNFCFWPNAKFEYENLSKGYAKLFQEEKITDCASVFRITESILLSYLPGFPNPKERLRLIYEVASVLQSEFDERPTKLLALAGNSASKLVDLIVRFFPGFQDHATYNGRQVFFYKRAQILVGDIYACYGGEGLGDFFDIEQLTCFPDYRIPQLFRELGLMKYCESLERKIDARKSLPAGGFEEVFIRVATVHVVELMKKYLTEYGVELKSIEIDWALWQRGEAIHQKMKPHHRVLTIFY